MNPGPAVKADRRRGLPSVDRLMRELRASLPDLPAWAAAEGAREALAAAREALGAPGAVVPAPEVLRDHARIAARALAQPHPRRVVNATGIVLHTNLGRAPLAPGAAEAAAAAARGYTDLELDLGSGERGQRSEAVVRKLRLLSGAADACVVNNNAAAMLLVLVTLAAGREVVVSRGELVEIGGSFRVPEILAAAGVQLVEVGTTNRTHPEDYARAVGPATALLLKVHRSNFTQQGFVRDVSLRELAEIAAPAGLPIVEDLGSGALFDLPARGFPPETFAPSRLREGADVVCFSGDKLLGGPQAGLVLARDAAHAQAMRRHPLARALRVDKLTLAALDWTLAAHLDGSAERVVPILRALLAPESELEARARRLSARLARIDGVDVEVAPDRTFAGGGSLPGFELPSWVVRLRVRGGAARAAEALRRGDPPVLVRVRDAALVIDPRTLDPSEEPRVEAAVRALPDGCAAPLPD